MNIKTEIKGTYFRGKEIMKIVNEMNTNVSLFLEREYDNLHDENAVKIIYNHEDFSESLHIGYVPKEISEKLAEELDNGKEHWITYLGNKKIQINEKQYKSVSLKEKKYEMFIEDDYDPLLDATPDIFVDASDLDNYLLDLL